ncbi:tetratricopeptide repeat protein [Streptomyces sp. SID5464]|uniref:tetratricopeptide repeat protein n=1 Tax=Streptomyces sp. SID5464 TaxID=2690293 RepID=UPI001319FCC1|nr:tetratricopeptide repeat protein [Streptomyces sp. SID5464]
MTNRGIIASGDHARIEQHNLNLPQGALQAAVPEAAITRLNNLPALNSRVFKGRDDALAFLRALPSTGTGIVAQSVRGMGGVGKSTLALHHARDCLAAGHGPVWWLDASSAGEMTAGLAALATAVNPVNTVLPIDEAAEWAVAWLQGRSGWLLILDNAEDPADLRPYLGRLSTGQVLITTRRDLPWQDVGTPLLLDTLAPRSSLAVLQEITGRHDDGDVASLIELADELGHLPLALQQAGAYLAQTRTSAGTYLAQLRTDPAGVLATAPPGDAQHRTIAQLWSVTLEALRTTDPNAVELLRILAYCAPDPLPRDLLVPALSAPQAVDHALGVLAAYSLITLSETDVAVHRLVQTVVRTTTPHPSPDPRSGRLRRLLRRSRPDAPLHPSQTALVLVSLGLPSGEPEDVTTWPDWQTLLPHIRTTSAQQPATGATSPLLTTVLGRAAFYLRARGQSSEALPLEERALRATEADLGPDHPETAIRLNNLALTLGDVGQHARALPLFERALRIAQAALGPDHNDTATCLSNLARTFDELGRHIEALPLAEQALQIS